MAKATLGGKTILDGPVSWSLRPGVVPYITEFEMIRRDAEQLAQGKLSPVTLVLGSPGAKGATIKFLYVIQSYPSDNPHTLMVRVADRRWFWSYVHVNHSFNIRRNIGIKRVKAGFNRPVLDPPLVDVLYAPWSLKGTARWTAKEALKEVWKTVQEPEKAIGPTPNLVIDTDIGSLTPETLPLEDVELADQGDGAMKRLLDFIPGANVTVKADGTVLVYSMASGKERGILDDMMPEQVAGGHAEMLNHSRIRPKEVNIYFVPEVELRFDAKVEVEAGASIAQSKKTDTFMENVLPVPDFQLGSFAQGTWIPITTALSQWPAIPKFGKLTIKAIRRALVPYLDLWTGARIAGLSDDKADWGSRIGAIQTHFRRTYRINPQITHRSRSLRAYRVATIDKETGTRAPSTAFQDWAVVATQRFLSVQLGGGQTKFQYATNFPGYPPGGTLTEQTPASPIRVSVLDSDQGIISLEFLQDPFRTHEAMLPSKVDNVPNGQIRAGLIAWNAIEQGRPQPELAASHKVITVLTVLPAGPNSKLRLIEMTRRPSDIKSILPAVLSGGLSNAQGPPMDVYIGPGWETARIAWADNDAGRIKAALGLNTAAADQAGDINSIHDLVVNAKAQTGKGDPAASLDSISNAVAAAIYAGFADRMGGSRTTPVTHQAQVEGFVESVLHSVAPDGVATSTVTVSPIKPNVLDFMSLMPKSTRNIILKIASGDKVS